MKTTYKVTNPEKFNGVRVFLDGVKCTDMYNGIRGNFCAFGGITIVKNGEQHDHSGEHGQNDYEEEYGFILIPEEWTVKTQGSEEEEVYYLLGETEVRYILTALRTTANLRKRKVFENAMMIRIATDIEQKRKTTSK